MAGLEATGSRATPGSLPGEVSPLGTQQPPPQADLVSGSASSPQWGRGFVQGPRGQVPLGNLELQLRPRAPSGLSWRLHSSRRAESRGHGDGRPWTRMVLRLKSAESSATVWGRGDAELGWRGSCRMEVGDQLPALLHCPTCRHLKKHLGGQGFPNPSQVPGSHWPWRLPPTNSCEVWIPGQSRRARFSVSCP